MASEQQKIVGLVDNEQPIYEREQISNPEELLQEGVKGLAKFGGLKLLNGLIKNVDKLDPSRKARKNDFLSSLDYEEERAALKKDLSLWVELLDNTAIDAMALRDKCISVRDSKEENLSQNLGYIHDEIRDLEVTYRNLDSYFANAGQSAINCVTLMNVDKEELATHDSEDTNAIRDEINQYYDKLDMTHSYSLLVLPGYLGNSATVRMWSDIAYKNKVMLITDFKDCETFEDLKIEMEKANLQSQDASAGNVIMTANYILARKKSEKAGEGDDLYIPASGALAGKMSNVDDIVIAQGAAGMKYGTLNNVLGTRMALKKSEIALLIDSGAVPMVDEFGRTMAFSNRTLYNGGSKGFQEYSIVRVFDWLGKVFAHFCNQKAGELYDSNVNRGVKDAIQRFLDENKGPGGIIEKCSGLQVIQDKVSKDIKINVEITPFFAAQNFYIELSGKVSNDNVDWSQSNKVKE